MRSLPRSICYYRYRGYENANFVSSKQITSFSDFRVPLDHPDHFTLPEYVKYLRAYMRHFRLEDHLHLKCKVVGVAPVLNKGPKPGGGHIVRYLDSRANPAGVKEIRADYVAVCSGLHVTPAWPEIPGIEYVVNPQRPIGENSPIRHEVYHSSEYKGRAQLTGRRVLVLGTGETGHDIAYEAVKAGATEVTLCTRSTLFFVTANRDLRFNARCSSKGASCRYRKYWYGNNVGG